MAYQQEQRQAVGQKDAAEIGGAPAPGKRTLTESLGGDPARGVEPGALRAGGGGAPLPDAVRAKMERSFGADFADIRIHVGDQASTIAALAYTSGSHIHFAPGRYAPETEAGQQLIGHELAHVIQQRGGRVAMPGGAGAPVNTDGGLEAEAEAAGARAARGEPAGLSGGGGGGGGGGEGPIQRAVGFEFEMLRWSSRFTDDDSPLPKGHHIVEADNFTMEGEDSPGGGSTIEFVTEPLPTRKDVTRVVSAASKMATDLIGKHTKGEDTKGREVEIDGTEDPGAGMHASPAVPLRNIPNLALALDQTKMTPGGSSMLPSLEQVNSKLDGLTIEGEDPSQELRGLLTLTLYYLNRGRTTGRSQFPKELTAVMARTTFTKMFQLLPEHGFFSREENAGVWEQLVLETFAPEHDPKDVGKMPVFSQNFNQLPPGPDTVLEIGSEDEGLEMLGAKPKTLHKLETTRSEWLSTMPEQDLLSRGVDERFEGMGAYGGATDTLRLVEEVSEDTAKALVPIIKSSSKRVKEKARTTKSSKKVVVDSESSSSEDEPLKERIEDKPDPRTEAPLFELRATGGGTDHPKGWVKTAENMFDMLHDVNQGQTYDAKLPDKKAPKRKKNYNAPFVVDKNPQPGGIDMTVPPEQQDMVPVKGGNGGNDDDDSGCCCCCWPFSLFCRC